LSEALALAFRESGFLGELLAHSDPEGELEKARALLNAAKELSINEPDGTIRTFLEHLRTLRENSFELETKPRGGAVPGKIRLMTVHRAKGQEFENVFIYNAADNRWGGRKKPNSLKLPADIWRAEDSGDPLEDERKLFYVALTRAKKNILITFSSLDQEGREVLPTRFLKEVTEENLETLDTKEYQSAYRLNPDLAKKPIPEESEKEAEFVKRLFEERSFSVTHLNNYLTCPWRYFYNNLLRIPETETRHQAYGTAAHNALRRLFEMRRREPIKKSDLIKFFEEELEKTKISAEDKKEALKKGRESLAGWYEANSALWPEEALVELSVSGVARNSIPLTGKIDKLEYLKNGEVRVIDFKTSKPQTRNKLLGLTKDADGNYLRQLAFYKFLLSQYDGGKYKMVEGVIDFLEPDEKKRYKSEVFAITEIPLEKTLLELDTTIKEIREFSFRDKFCNDPDCAYCALRKQIIT
jgi:DNA helicase-2/ATP-dependent DNA helicase PcrA